MNIIKKGSPCTDLPVRPVAYEYDHTNISANPFDLIDQNTESIMNLLEDNNAAPENNV
jgi:hypothetical protein